MNDKENNTRADVPGRKKRSESASSWQNKSLGLSMPTISDDLVLNDPAEEDEDAGEEKKLMTILLKLKTAKENVSTNKKRKHCERLVEDQLAKHHSAVREFVHKHTGRRVAILKKLQTECQAIQTDVDTLAKAAVENGRRAETVQRQRSAEVRGALTKFRTAVESDVRAVRRDYGQVFSRSKTFAASQVVSKLEQLEVWATASEEGSKQDKLSSLIQTVLTTF